ncbi:MAG: SsrA-binding protein [Candidatus Magasanikbacteria bacterium CG10_big_fil_rev_8_21_14_0_10_47_10]|uniref:SsrA-binding protein n=1 Tax=Candidatus Magasanikbacteria bacterium CG10_big_fil_rev_8_21_14_0_10_47_10 TaxID=1974652 RepID=A0A2H0TQW0_9BACT|nr:MAG: SsrA-binding protein [Candidatus Magasanikbacteria bacterium CG10_big_fil_rev_8_21_14_0_10_47_10]
MPVYAKNKKAYHDYEILETLEAGLVLDGHEVKAVRNGQMKLSGGYVTFHNEEAYLTNAHISRYKFTGTLEAYDPDKSRKLLLKKSEIAYLSGKSKERGLTIVPLSVYTSGRHIKLQIGVARGKKLYDKREKIKERDLKRQEQIFLKKQH